MSQIEYLIPLLSIIVGLALADLVRSLRALLRAGRTVQWHWLPLTWTAIVFLIIVQLWWNSFGLLQQDLFAEALAFFPYLLIFLVLYLTCSFALPDPTWEAPVPPRTSRPNPFSPEKAASSGSEPLDLEAFYYSAPQRQRFFGTLATLSLLLLLLSAGVSIFWAGQSPIDPGVVYPALGNLAMALVLVGLAITDRGWAHGGAAIVTFGVLIYALITQGQLF